jgi:hypothetical protein
MNATSIQPKQGEDFEDFSARFDRERKVAKDWAVKEGYGLKGIKIFLPGSDETICFQASITKNGKVVGAAENDGHGGCTFIHVKALTIEENSKLEAYVDDLVNDEVSKKEVAKAESSAKRWAKKKGFKFLAMKWLGDGQLSYVGGGAKEGLEAHLAKKGYIGYNVISLEA